MKVELFTICDSAVEYNGKAVIVGTFNEVSSPSYPVNMPNFNLVARLSYERDESPIKEVSISSYHVDDTDLKIMNFKFPRNVDMKINPDKRNFINVMLKLDNIVIPKPGTYKIAISDGESVADIEFYAVRIDNQVK